MVTRRRCCPMGRCWSRGAMDHSGLSFQRGAVRSGHRDMDSDRLVDYRAGVSHGDLAAQRQSHWSRGVYNGGYLSSAELYDVGLGFSASWQPQIATFTSPLSLGSSCCSPVPNSVASPKVPAAIAVRIRRRITRWCNCAAWKAGRPCSCCPRTGPRIRSLLRR